MIGTTLSEVEVWINLLSELRNAMELQWRWHRSSENDTLAYNFFAGSFKEWHKNGQLKKEAILQKGKSVGFWKLWNKNGKLIKTSDKTFEFKLN